MMDSGATSDKATDDLATTRQRLLELHRQGSLAQEYPQVRRLLAEIDDADLLQFGYLLAALDPNDVLRRNPGQYNIRVAITGHGTLGPLVPALTVELARHGILIRPYVADFSSYIFDLSDPESQLYRTSPDVTLCVLDPCVVMDELPVPWSPADVESILARKIELIEQAVNTFETCGRGTLVFNTIPLLRELSEQLVDYSSRARLGAVWREAACSLLSMCQERSQVVVIDVDPLIGTGLPAVDPRQSRYAKVNLSTELLFLYAREVGHLARRLTGQVKKCLVLDLDETLWGGTLGDLGVFGIEIADGYRGDAFLAFQKVVKQIGAQGVLLAVVSKNDLELVREAFRSHPGMILREDDFVWIAANWRAKYENIQQLSKSVNLATDSFVFVDDSAYECGLIRHALPEVAVVQLNREPAFHITNLLGDGWFDVPELTREDRDRSAQYRTERERRTFLDKFSGVDDYLRELCVEVHLARMEEKHVARVSQLTLRTNQFNLTTRRLDAQDVRARLTDPLRTILVIETRDRFGDGGVAGVIILCWVVDELHIENFVLSCRFFSRGIEQTCLSVLLSHARARQAKAVIGSFRPTAKNMGVQDFYSRFGFAPAGTRGNDVFFRHDLVDVIEPPDHVQVTTDFEGGSR